MLELYVTVLTTLREDAAAAVAAAAAAPAAAAPAAAAPAAAATAAAAAAACLSFTALAQQSALRLCNFIVRGREANKEDYQRAPMVTLLFSLHPPGLSAAIE